MKNFNCRLIIQFKYSSKRDMDRPQRDGVSDTTLPSEQGEMVSNLSTKPNNSEQNDLLHEDILNPSEPSVSNHPHNENHYPTHSQKPLYHRSHSFDQLHSQPPLLYSAPPLKQSRLPRQSVDNPPSLNTSSANRFQLTTFDEDWQRNLKQEEEEREKYHEMINTDNEPLLSQRSEAEPEYLQADDSNQQEDDKSELSNEVKFQKIGANYSGIINEESACNSSISQKDEQRPALFELGIKEDSQSNLLNFGFILHRSQQDSRPSQISQRTSGENHNLLQQTEKQNMFLQHKQEPMEIQQPKPHPTTIESAEENSVKFNNNAEIQIKINDCNDELLNSTVKNNDIYGISEHHSNVIDFQEAKEECKAEEHASNKIENSQSKLFSNQKQQKETFLTEQQKLSRLTLEDIIEEMQRICEREGPRQERAQRGNKLLSRHFDFYYFKPISDIGHELTKDGSTACKLIQIILLKETEAPLIELLSKYLILTFAKLVERNREQFINYQQLSSKNKSYSSLLKNHDLPKHATFNQSLNFTNISMNESLNDESVYAVHGSSAQKSPPKSPDERMDVSGQRDPVKRTAISKHLFVQAERPPSPKSNKRTRKTRNKSNKAKGKTTTKKDTKVQFEQQLSHPQASNQRDLRSRSKVPTKSVTRSQSKMSARKSQIVKIKSDSIAKDVNEAHFGSKFTFVFKENQIDHSKYLVQRRVSQRLAGRGSLSKHDTSLVQGQGSKKKRTSTSLLEEEDLDIDYIKKHLRSINIKSSLMEKDFGALTPEDKQVADLLKKYEELVEEQENEMSQHNVQDTNEPEDNTASMHSYSTSQVNSKMRFEEFKKNLTKYKVSDIPIVISRIVDPDINHHGIYALLELGRLSQIVYNARFALTPITNLSRASKRLIDEDLIQAKRQLGDEGANLVYLQPTESTLQLIKLEQDRRIMNK